MSATRYAILVPAEEAGKMSACEWADGRSGERLPIVGSVAQVSDWMKANGYQVPELEPVEYSEEDLAFIDAFTDELLAKGGFGAHG